MKAKACWLARETKKGWRLKLCVGNRDYPIRGLLLASRKDVKRTTDDLSTVYIHMSGVDETVVK